MKAIALFCLLCTGIIPAPAEDAKHPIHSAPTHRAPDLDFADDNDSDRVNDKPVPFRSAAKLAPASHSWIFLTLGFSAAAGGMAFYFWESGKSSAPTKTVQVFTDAPD